MVKFESDEFLNELKENLIYWQNVSNMEIDDLLYRFYDIMDDDFDPAEYDDNYIGYDSIATLNCGDYDCETELTYRELFGLIDAMKNTKLIDNTKCITENYFLCRVSADYEQIQKLNKFIISNRAFEIEDKYKNSCITCSIICGITLFGLMIMANGDYDNDVFPPVLDEDYFVEIKSQNKLSIKDYQEIFNSYIFEIDSSYDIRLKMNRRPHMDYEEESEDCEEDDGCSEETRVRPLLFGKGIPEVLNLYNSVKGNTNLDMVIIQYTKILEYISQTVVRQKTTQILQSKLMTSQALNPNADFIRELEFTFDELKQKYNTDRNLIKSVIESCCDIEYISNYVPPYLKKIKDIPSKLKKTKANKEQCIKEAIELLSNAISDTRNYIAHSKANYTLNGHECPENEKHDFTEMLRIISTQAIRWFSTIFGENRITNE